MKAKVRLIMVLAGLTVAIITAGVPVVRMDRNENSERQSASKCYSEKEILFLMETTNTSRTHAVEVLDLACKYAITPE